VAKLHLLNLRYNNKSLTFVRTSFMNSHRERDPAQSTFYRSDRISAVNGQFFFTTREGTLEGPYFTRTDAQREVQRYIDRYARAKELIERSFP
jgi:hypothetical protein